MTCERALGESYLRLQGGVRAGVGRKCRREQERGEGRERGVEDCQELSSHHSSDRGRVKSNSVVRFVEGARAPAEKLLRGNCFGGLKKDARMIADSLRAARLLSERRQRGIGFAPSPGLSSGGETQ